MAWEVSTEEMNQLCLAVGAVMVFWGQAEINLTFTVNLLHSTHGPTPENQVPQIAFKKRVEFIKKASKSAIPKEMQTELRALLARAKAYAKTRDMLVHGFASEYSNAAREVTFVGWTRSKAAIRRHDRRSQSSLSTNSGTIFSIFPPIWRASTTASKMLWCLSRRASRRRAKSSGSSPDCSKPEASQATSLARLSNAGVSACR